MFPGTFGGHARVATPVNPTRKRKRIRRTRCPDVIGTIANVGGDAAIAFDGSYFWVRNNTGDANFEWNVDKVALADLSTAVVTFTISEYYWPDTYGGVPVLGADAAGDFLFIGIDHETGAHGFGGYVAYLTVKKRSTGGTVTSIGEVFDARLLASPGAGKGAFYDPATDSVFYLLTDTPGGTSAHLKSVTPSGTVTTIANLTLDDEAVTFPFVGRNGTAWWLEATGMFTRSLARWSPVDGYDHVPGLVVDSSVTFAIIGVFPDDAVLVAQFSDMQLAHPDLTYGPWPCTDFGGSTAERYIGTEGFLNSYVSVGTGEVWRIDH